jgi:hypothetical protein
MGLKGGGEGRNAAEYHLTFRELRRTMSFCCPEENFGQSRTAQSHMHSENKSSHVSHRRSDRGERSENEILEVKSNPEKE